MSSRLPTMNARRYPRTMTEAFGPYTDNRLEPIPGPKRSRVDRLCMVLGWVLFAALMVAAAFTPA